MADVEAGQTALVASAAVEDGSSSVINETTRPLSARTEGSAPVIWDKTKRSVRMSANVIVEPVAEVVSQDATLSDNEIREFARRSLANAREPPPPPDQGNATALSRFENVVGVAVAMPDDPSQEADAPAEVYYVDASTGKAMVTKSTTHKGRPASVTMEVAPDGHVVQVVGGTARLPGETPRQYFRKMSSFAIWQLHESPGTPNISWNGDQKYAYFSYLVIFVTGILLFVELGVNGGVEPFAINPTFGPTRDVLVRMGAKRTDLIVEKGQFYRLISSWWLHAGILHWVVNMLALLNLGLSLEKEFGTPKIAIIFCFCGFMGALCSAVFLPNVVGVGASGAIFGLFGSCFADLIQNWGLYKSRGNARTTLCQLVFGAVLNFLLGLIPMLDQFAHLGGFCTGVSLGFILLLQKRYTRFGEEKIVKRRQRFFQMCGMVTAPAGMITFLAILYTGISPEGWCSWCHFINCIPISGLWNCDDTGCSDDPIVRGIPFPNSTMEVYCPSSTNGKIVYAQLETSPTAEDVIAYCQSLCFN